MKEAVVQARADERARIRQALNKKNLPDAKEWETGTGGKLEKVLLFTRQEWTDFWEALESGTMPEVK